jgi:ubiquinone/menaquinone biosynthesis C-methylase UbiE
MIMKNDRFSKIAKNYGELFSEVFEVQGLGYDELQHTIFEQVTKLGYNKNTSILDIGVGDGRTSRAFIDAGYTDLTGLDLNPEMLAQTKAKYGDKITLVQGDTTDLHMFDPGQFPVIISATTVHNIAKADRKKFWAEMIRLKPELLVLADKVTDPDPVKHQASFDSEVKAIHEVFGRRHNLPEAEQVWVEHYNHDERERMEISEIQSSLGHKYNIAIVYESGMNKTVVCTRK